MARKFGGSAKNGGQAGAEIHRDGARRVVARAIRAGADAYVRERDLPKLIRIDRFGGNAPETRATLGTIVTCLERALRAERQRARSGHWTYDLNRHIALHQAYLAETMRLAAMKAPQ